MNELLSGLKPAWTRNENSPDVSPEFGAGPLQTSMYPRVAGSGAAANAGTAHKAPPTSTPSSTTSLRIQLPPIELRTNELSMRTAIGCTAMLRTVESVRKGEAGGPRATAN